MIFLQRLRELRMPSSRSPTHQQRRRRSVLCEHLFRKEWSNSRVACAIIGRVSACRVCETEEVCVYAGRSGCCSRCAIDSNWGPDVRREVKRDD